MPNIDSKRIFTDHYTYDLTRDVLFAMTLSAKKQSRWLVAILIAALLLPWCRVLCTTMPMVSTVEHCAGHATSQSLSQKQQSITQEQIHSHSPLVFSLGVECPDDQQSITANPYSSLDSLAKQLPLWLAFGSALVVIFSIFNTSTFTHFRTRSPAAPPIRRHLLFCVIRD